MPKCHFTGFVPSLQKKILGIDIFGSLILSADCWWTQFLYCRLYLCVLTLFVRLCSMNTSIFKWSIKGPKSSRSFPDIFKNNCLGSGPCQMFEADLNKEPGERCLNNAQYIIYSSINQSDLYESRARCSVRKSVRICSEWKWILHNYRGNWLSN